MSVNCVPFAFVSYVFTYQFSNNYRELFILLCFGSFFFSHPLSVVLNFMIYYALIISYIQWISSNVLLLLLLFVEYWTPKKNRKTNDKYFINWHALRHCWHYDIFSSVHFYLALPRGNILINMRRQKENPTTKLNYFRNFELHFSKCSA